ncbi:uncharacterized protein EV154DRAFT_546544 [Mucor mucedo]|uniref:uncharacterized protein n=1 Tax=Mucor mucedo TaxID=29922 RepID=UPI00221F1C28|nr:uncharacterized protein EV154DRAFT_546544 [Mucor mucedo]KAI7865307.1 hypothetical protein EV154DRAFT_546544 [Mucor mucedo]
MSKLILRDQEVITIITTTLISRGALHFYTPRPTEWLDGSQSDVLYAPAIASVDLPPVLVEIQRDINHHFVDRLVGYALHVEKEYKIKPSILVFGIGKTCNNIKSKFNATQHNFAKQLVCDHWAEKCLIIDCDTIGEDNKELPLLPLLAIGIFLCFQKASLMSIEYKDDTTLQMLYKIAKEQAEKEKAEEPQFTKLKEVISAMPEGLLQKRALSYAEDGCLYTDTCKRKYSKKDLSCTSPMPAPLDLPEAGLNLIHEFEANNNNDAILPELDIPKSDMDYVIQFKRSSKPMNWKECYEVGKRDGFFTVYTSPASLKRAHYKKKPVDDDD